MEGMRKGGTMMNDVNKSEEDECFASCVCVHEKRESRLFCIFHY